MTTPVEFTLRVGDKTLKMSGTLEGGSVPPDPSPPGWYVAVDGDNANPGNTPATPWRTIARAVDAVQPGETVYIKSGDYGKEEIVFNKSGTPGQPITLQGYQTVPGDTPAPTYTVGDKVLDPAVMPLLDGQDHTSMAFACWDHDWVSFKNLQVQRFEHGIYFHRAENCTVDNCVMLELGWSDGLYVGKGIVASGTHLRVSDCILSDIGSEALSIYGNENLVQRCKVYGVTPEHGGSYYITVIGDDNRVEDCLIHRTADLPVRGHGIGTKGDAKRNKFISCTAIGLNGSAYVVRHSGSQFNEFIDCKGHHGGIPSQGIGIRDGARENKFINCDIEADSALFCLSTVEDGAKGTGFNNVLEGCTFKITDGGKVFDLNKYSTPQNGMFADNVFRECSFEGGQHLYDLHQPNQNNLLDRCTIKGVKKLKTGPVPPGFNYSDCLFVDNGFPDPT